MVGLYLFVNKHITCQFGPRSSKHNKRYTYFKAILWRKFYTLNTLILFNCRLFPYLEVIILINILRMERSRWFILQYFNQCFRNLSISNVYRCSFVIQCSASTLHTWRQDTLKATKKHIYINQAMIKLDWHELIDSDSRYFMFAVC